MAKLKQEITLLSGIGQLSTTLLGTGLFMVPAIAAGIAGAYSLWAWLVLFIAILPIALTFAHLGKRFPNAGGTAFFVRQAFNPKLEKTIAWLFLSIIPVGVPAAIALAAGFLQPLLPSQLSHPLLVQLITIGLLVMVNLLGSKSSSRLQAGIAMAIFALVICLTWFGEVSTSDIHMPPLSADKLPSIAAAIAVMFWCFLGIEAFAHMGEEFKNPQRDFPIALIIGCLIAGATYWASSVVILKYHAYGSAQFDSGSIPFIADQLFGSQFHWLISLLGFAACFASINLYTQSLSRMLWAQTHAYRPSSRLANLSAQGVPANATLAIATVLAISCVVGEISGFDLEVFVKLANGIFVLVYLIAMLSAVYLFSGWHKIMAMLGSVICLGLFVCLGWSMLYAIILFGLFLLVINRQPKTAERQQSMPT
ncbi:L-methionine/branched-chain amino acid transporter [Vibrio intestinalis]|uniref:L-methionine/branched-chain amino acid transporter n=1 Tax=Vibrio intestinalis TaxID=2933291 RepID=UPI0021A3B375|nr:L-methionine/branched-chain amino acid transporter [Vibrio intestinalis]